MELNCYIDNEIIPRYDHFDKAHRRDHVLKVIKESLLLAGNYDVDHDMVYAIAAYHDTGLCRGREIHHLVSGRIVREDEMLRRWFDGAQIEVMARAVEDHRASSEHEPRSIYGKIVAEADRDIDPIHILRRTIQYGLSHYPELNGKQQYQRFLDHLHEKYAEGGYMKLWIPESRNAEQLELLRDIIRDENRLQKEYEKLLLEECDF